MQNKFINIDDMLVVTTPLFVDFRKLKTLPNDLFCCGRWIILSPIRTIREFHKYIETKKTLKKNEDVKNLICTFFDIQNSWESRDVIVGYKVRNTHIIVVTIQASSQSIVKQMERNWDYNDNFVIVQVDIDNVDVGLLMEVNDNISKTENNKIKIFNIGENNSTDLRNFENIMITLKNPDYYGLLFSKCICEYF
jgi:hypothetical protein